MTGTFIVLAAWNSLSASIRTSRPAVERAVRDSDLGAARRDEATQLRFERGFRQGWGRKSGEVPAGQESEDQ